MSDHAISGAPPSLEAIQALAEEALELIPEALRQHLEGVAIRVEDFPDDEIVEDMELEGPFELLGLYQGVSLTERSLGDVTEAPDMIFLYRRPILDFWCEGEDGLAAIVRHVLIHEAGHHFGFSDEDMDRLERAADEAAELGERSR